jgi:hypothetical protein
MLNRRIWILPPFLSAVFVLTIFLSSSQAALLKDIRIGEYDQFTRIVFELDSPTEPEQIIPISSGQLKIVFAYTSAEFIRKIPVERSRHIKNIQIWDKSNQLSAVFNFDFEHFRHESFPLNDPPRIVLDIQPLENGPETTPAAVPSESNTTGTALPQVPESTAPEPASIDLRESTPAANEIIRAGNGAELNNSPSLKVSPANNQTIPTTRSSDFDNRSKKNDEPKTNSTVSDHQKPIKQSNRLQFYLVVVLVLITIFILVLLLLMLLSRHRWADGNTHLRPKEFLNNQDKHIASLDARIKEQLKRYEEV